MRFDVDESGQEILLLDVGLEPSHGENVVVMMEVSVVVPPPIWHFAAFMNQDPTLFAFFTTH